MKILNASFKSIRAQKILKTTKHDFSFYYFHQFIYKQLVDKLSNFKVKVSTIYLNE